MMTHVVISAQDPATYVHHLQIYFLDLLSMSSRRQAVLAAVQVNIDKWICVFLRDNSVRSSLTQRYKGLYHAMEKRKKRFP